MKFLGLAIGAFAIVASLGYGPATAVAAGSGQPAAVLNQAVNAFNKGDMKSWAGMCDSPAVVIDDFPPHLWQGATACADWARAFTAMMKQQGMKPGMLSLGPAWHSAITGNRAYLVYPATFSYQQKGKAMSEAGVLTFAMNKTANGWRTVAWSWGDRH